MTGLAAAALGAVGGATMTGLAAAALGAVGGATMTGLAAAALGAVGGATMTGLAAPALGAVGGATMTGLAINNPAPERRTTPRMGRLDFSALVFIEGQLPWSKLCTRRVTHKLYESYNKSNFFSRF
jgi:hypothetical protein